MAKSVTIGLRARDAMERDPAASLKFNGVVSELQAKLDGGRNCSGRLKL